MRILIVDDEPLELEQIDFLIHKKYPSWTVFQADDAAQAKKVLEAQPIDLALLDIHLPGESGLSLCSYLKEKYQTECIMITAYGKFHYAREAIKMHVFDFIVKPVIEKEFYETLEKFKNQFGYLDGVSPLIQQVIDRIQENYASKLNLTDLADQVHVSSSYLSRKFSEELNMNFQEYLVQYRIEKAKQFLKDCPDWSIQRVSEETGFTSPTHFSYTFKKVVQLSPRQYKENFTHD